MIQAATGLALAILQELGRGQRRRQSVLLLVGGGNNGADALYAGAYLARRGLAVHAALCTAQPLRTAQPHNRALRAARSAGVRTYTLSGDQGHLDLKGLTELARRTTVWVDGLSGIGAR